MEDNNKQNYVLSDQTLGVSNTEERFSSKPLFAVSFYVGFD